jgi:transposase
MAKVLLRWGSEILDEIEEVSIDLWKGYKSLVEEIIPKAQVADAITRRFSPNTVRLRDNWRLKPQLYNQSPRTLTDIRVDARLNRTVLGSLRMCCTKR